MEFEPCTWSNGRDFGPGVTQIRLSHGFMALNTTTNQILEYQNWNQSNISSCFGFVLGWLAAATATHSIRSFLVFPSLSLSFFLLAAVKAKLWARIGRNGPVRLARWLMFRLFWRLLCLRERFWPQARLDRELASSRSVVGLVDGVQHHFFHRRDDQKGGRVEVLASPKSWNGKCLPRLLREGWTRAPAKCDQAQLPRLANVHHKK